MNLSTTYLKKIICHKKRLMVVAVLLLGTLAYFLFFRTVVVNPVTEGKQMRQLEEVKQHYSLGDFSSDGCSGNVSRSWNIAVKELSKVSSKFNGLYTDTKNIPFEYACTVHDKAYYTGEGGYTARLQADNTLRSEIISYGINNTKEIQERTGLNTKEEAIFLYEVVAETVYRGVRLGGTPCTGASYAWGFGYNNGVCTW